jgi:hypothetical protein
MKSQDRKGISGIALAAAAAALFLAAPQTVSAADEGSAQGRCLGANACKGQSACKSANNACKGQNACKGKGFIETGSTVECTVIKSKM